MDIGALQAKAIHHGEHGGHGERQQRERRYKSSI
jgi:hypothetical protein